MRNLGGKVINTFLMADDFAIIEVIATKNVRYRIKVDHDMIIPIKKSGATIKFKNGIPHCYFLDAKTITLGHFILGNTRLKVSYNNNDVLDLRKANLTRKIKDPLTDSQYNIPGVYPNRNKSNWIANIHYKDHHHFLGCFDTEIEAASAVFIKWLQIYDEKMSRKIAAL